MYFEIQSAFNLKIMKIELNTESKELKNRLGGSVLLKLALIGFLTLILLIPSVLIQELITEREGRQEEVNLEISEKWSGSQLVQGPVLVLPYKTISKAINQESDKISSRELVTNIYILPETLTIDSKAEPETLHRGIFDAVVYKTQIKVNGNFSTLEIKKSGINPEMILWDKAKVVIGLSDLKGLDNKPILKVGDVDYEAEPDFTGLKLFSNNLIVLPDLANTKNSNLTFSFDLNIRGSNQLSFLHIGKNTTVNVKGTWKNPSFIGRYLPEQRHISDSTFSASWKMPYFNRPFPQQWIEENSNMIAKDSTSVNSIKAQDILGAFGVKFLMPIDQYQKTYRTAKYAILIILLTFISLLFTELLSKKKVHLLQYVLIGAAMIIFYALLLSLSEQMGFNLAYLIASFATVGLIGLFIQSLLKSRKTALLFAGILGVLYSFIFIIIQLQDMALLVGSIGLFLIIAALMYLSQKVSLEKNRDEMPNTEA
jgi:inner membrane protein